MCDTLHRIIRTLHINLQNMTTTHSNLQLFKPKRITESAGKRPGGDVSWQPNTLFAVSRASSRLMSVSVLNVVACYSDFPDINILGLPGPLGHTCSGRTTRGAAV